MHSRANIFNIRENRLLFICIFTYYFNQNKPQKVFRPWIYYIRVMSIFELRCNLYLHWLTYSRSKCADEKNKPHMQFNVSYIQWGIEGGGSNTPLPLSKLHLIKFSNIANVLSFSACLCVCLIVYRLFLFFVNCFTSMNFFLCLLFNPFKMR